MTVNLAKKIVGGVERPLVRHLMKHQSYCQVLIGICSRKNFLIHERRKALMMIEMCIKLELDLIQHLQLMISENNLPATNFLLRKYEMEEKWHYSMLNQLIERVFRDKSKEKMLRRIYSPETVFGLVPPLSLFRKELKMARNNSRRRSALIL